MTSGGGTDDGEVSAVTRAAAAHARRRAGEEMPTPDALIGLAVDASQVTGMSSGQIRELAAQAVAHAQQISFLLGRLAELVGEDEDGAR